MTKNRNRFAVTGDTQDSTQDTAVETTATETAAEETATEVVTPTVEVTAEPVAQATPEVATTVVQSEPVVEAATHQFDLKTFQASEILNSLLTRVQATGNAAVVITVQGLLDYCHDMRPGATMTNQEGARHQSTLFRLFQAVLERSGKDFSIAMSTTLRIIEEGRTLAFHDKYALRFMEDLTLNYDDQQAFARLLHLFKMMAPVQSRKDAARQINFNKIMEFGVSQEARYRVQTFFNI